MIGFRRPENPHLLAVSMAGIKIGDRIVQIGCANGDRMAAIASKVGLSGRAVALVPDEASAARAEKGAAKAGVLVDVNIAPPTRLSIDANAFDIAIIDDTDHLLSQATTTDRAATIQELFRVLRPGGRLLVVSTAARAGLGGLLARGPKGPTVDAVPDLQTGGFRTVRVLAEREGLRFLEGVKPR
jgi:ubiquinone/menaquinone biosynthesis C-methylase UbiE